MAILDQGYQHWQGQVAGHAWRWLAIARQGVRVNMKSIWVRILLILALLPALAHAAAIAIWGLVEQRVGWAIAFFSSELFRMQAVASDPIAYRTTAWRLIFHLFLHIEMFFAMIVVVSIGPGLISRDLRFNALPLYFSRPIRRFDYFLGKLGTITWFLLMVTVVPSILAWVLGILFSLNFSVAIDTLPILGAVIVYGVIVSVSAGLLMLAMSSLTRKSGYVVLMWCGMWLGGGLITQVLEGVFIVTQTLSRDVPRMERWQRRMSEESADSGKRAWIDQQADGAAREKQNRELEEREQQRRAEAQKDKQELMADVAAFKEAWSRDWRLLPSFSQNQLRIGDALLGTYDAMDTYHGLRSNGVRTARRYGPSPPPGSEEMQQPPMLQFQIAEQGLEPRWPWHWSAGVLLALAAVSVWILQSRVRSLDRLK
jgi:hypothetical protein